jgi:tRNA pseudouridine38/39 synthase
VALNLRSAAKVDEAELCSENELDYVLLLNKVLPDDIRVLGWSDVPGDFSARCETHCAIVCSII